MHKITLHLSDAVYEVFEHRAKDQRRSLKAEIELQLEADAGLRRPLAPTTASTGALPASSKGPKAREAKVAKEPQPRGRPPAPPPELAFPVDWSDRSDLDPATNQVGLAGVYANGSRFRVRVLNGEGITEVLGPFDTPLAAAQVRRDYYKAYGLPPGPMRVRKQLLAEEEAAYKKLERDYAVGLQMGLTPEQIEESIRVTDAHIEMANAGIRFGTEPDDMISQPVRVDLFGKYHKRFLEQKRVLEEEMTRLRAERGLPPVQPKPTLKDFPGLIPRPIVATAAGGVATAAGGATRPPALLVSDIEDGPDPGEFDPSAFPDD